MAEIETTPLQDAWLQFFAENPDAEPTQAAWDNPEHAAALNGLFEMGLICPRLAN